MRKPGEDLPLVPCGVWPLRDRMRAAGRGKVEGQGNSTFAVQNQQGESCGERGKKIKRGGEEGKK